MTEQRYVPRLDTLRAFAVTIVVLFHLDPRVFPWGYVGVDIFFSISGFLMTWIITRAAASERGFSIRSFLGRRFWRIFPPLAATILLTLVACLALFSPTHLEKTAEAALAGLLALSNIYFFGEEGYFDVASSVKPLLHTWSLGAEEQFYAFLALMIWLFGVRRLAAVMVLAGAGSLAAYLFVLAANGPMSGTLVQLHDEPLSALFFLPQYRFFQFAAGGVAAVLYLRMQGARFLPEAAGFSVLIAGLTAAAFGGTAAIAPIAVSFGMMMLMLRSETLDRASQNGVVAYLARISYQVYLVHWPIVVLYQYVRLEPLRPGEAVLCGLLSLVLGDLLYRATNPLRERAR